MYFLKNFKYLMAAAFMGGLLLTSCAGKIGTDAAKSAGVETDNEAYNIVHKSESINSGEDQISTLTFNITDKEGTNRKVILTRYWKNYQPVTDSEFLTKTLIFHKYPPESKGTAFMVWSYKYGLNKEDDRWIYLPILRKVNQLPSGDESGFHGSDLKSSDMVPRPASFDEHRLLKEEERDGKNYFVVESTPKTKDAGFQYGKLIKWIRKDNFLKDYIEYYDLAGNLIKKAHFKWTEKNGAKVWERVELDNIPTNVKTTLDITDIQVNAGVKDSIFLERTMKGGIESIR